MNIITAVLIVLIIAAACVFVWDKIRDNKPTPDQDTDFTSETSSGGENTDGNGDGESVGEVSVEFTNEYTATHVVEMEFEKLGTLKIELDANVAPITVSNFVSLVESGFYDGLTIHRAQSGFVIQGGDPMGNGYGGSEKCIKGEFAQNGVKNTLTHTRGAISMARSGDPDSASSQFFIVHQDAAKSSLDGRYAAFGYVTEGMEIVDKICTEAKPTDAMGMLAKEDQPKIKKVTVTKK